MKPCRCGSCWSCELAEVQAWKRENPARNNIYTGYRARFGLDGNRPVHALRKEAERLSKLVDLEPMEVLELLALGRDPEDLLLLAPPPPPRPVEKPRFVGPPTFVRPATPRVIVQVNRPIARATTEEVLMVQQSTEAEVKAFLRQRDELSKRLQAERDEALAKARTFDAMLADVAGATLGSSPATTSLATSSAGAIVAAVVEKHAEGVTFEALYSEATKLRHMQKNSVRATVTRMVQKKALRQVKAPTGTVFLPVH